MAMATETRTMKTREVIDDFLAQKRLAVAGVSRDEKDYSRMLFHELEQRGYDVVPVNPNATEIGGRQCYARVQDIAPPVDAVLVLTPATASRQVVADCAEAGISRVWLRQGARGSSLSREAVEEAVRHGMRVVPGLCPFMFLPETAFFHKLHRFFTRVPEVSTPAR